MGTALKEIILPVKDLNEQVSFYQNVLKLKLVEPKGVKDFQEFYTAKLQMDGGCTLVLHSQDQDAADRQNPKFLLRVTDIEAMRKELLARGFLLSEIQIPVEGNWVCEGIDPEGNHFTLEAGKKRTPRIPKLADVASPVPSVAANSLLGRLIVLLRENKIAIALEIIFMLTIFYLTAFFGSDLMFTTSVLVMFLLWLRGSNLGALGVRTPGTIWVTVTLGIVAGVLLRVIDLGFIVPYLSSFIREIPPLSPFAPIRGNAALFIQQLFSVWISAAIGEEFVFRGYLLNRLADLFGQKTWGWIAALLIQAIIFASGHAYEGTVGMIDAGIIGIILGVMYLAARRNLWLTVVVHGTIDTISFVLIFLGL